MLPEITREELGTVLDSLAAETLASADILQPPVDALKIAQRLGLTLAWDDQQAGRARLVQFALPAGSSGPSILLKHDPRQERVHWAVAHEIGEAFTARIFDELRIDARHAPPQAREQVANNFASRLLLPGDWFGDDGSACRWDLLELKHRYETASHELIARRMLDFPPLVVISIYDQNRQTWRKSNLPGRWPPPSRHELTFQKHAHESGEIAADDGPPLLQAWPIHEPQWKREILRLEIDELAWD